MQLIACHYASSWRLIWFRAASILVLVTAGSSVRRSTTWERMEM